jgi:hypothetical protein
MMSRVLLADDLMPSLWRWHAFHYTVIAAMELTGPHGRPLYVVSCLQYVNRLPSGIGVTG